MLINIFSRFGDLIDVYMLQNKNCGYAKYASESSALAAIDVLHRAEICGVKLKVIFVLNFRILMSWHVWQCIVAISYKNYVFIQLENVTEENYAAHRVTIRYMLPP